ncbi:hypothetical protein BDW62DRAFT_205644 [Aspergillus aurantiobrunneus]
MATIQPSQRPLYTFTTPRIVDPDRESAKLRQSRPDSRGAELLPHWDNEMLEKLVTDRLASLSDRYCATNTEWMDGNAIYTPDETPRLELSGPKMFTWLQRLDAPGISTVDLADFRRVLTDVSNLGRVDIPGFGYCADLEAPLAWWEDSLFDFGAGPEEVPNPL